MTSMSAKHDRNRYHRDDLEPDWTDWIVLMLIMLVGVAVIVAMLELKRWT